MDTNRITGPGYYPKRPTVRLDARSAVTSTPDGLLTWGELPWWGFCNRSAFPTPDRLWINECIAIEAATDADAEARMEALGFTFGSFGDGWHRNPAVLHRHPTASNSLYRNAVCIFADGSFGTAIEGQLTGPCGTTPLWRRY